MPEIWTALLILSKFLVFLGIAGGIGACLNMFLITHLHVLLHRYSVIRKWQNNIGKYALIFISLGFMANIADFFIQTGNLSETGFIGMFDPLMLEIIWISNIGTLSVIRALLFALTGAMMLYVLKSPYPLKNTAKIVVLGFLTTIIIVGLSYTFSISGHTKHLAFGSVVLITLHVALVFSWLGSLIPLIYATYLFNNKELHDLMTRFGTYASWGVVLLFVAGAGMLIQLLSSINELFTTAYGQLFIFKISLVLAMLIFAISHKFSLVPRLLQEGNGRIKLRYSIVAEFALGLLTLVTTSIITTVVGPNY